MKAARFRFLYLLFLMSTLTQTVSGCAVGNKSFSMDSTSRMPFFGFELKERKAKNSNPSYNSISRSSEEESRVETMLQVGASKSKYSLKKTDRQVVATSDYDASCQADLGKPQPIQSIPLPLNTKRSVASDRPPSGQIIDFQ